VSGRWQPGDLALVVRDGRIPCPHNRHVSHTGALAPPRGSIFVVADARPTTVNSGAIACGCLDLVPEGGGVAVAMRCIKVTPEGADAFDREVIEHLTAPAPRALPAANARASEAVKAGTYPTVMETQSWRDQPHLTIPPVRSPAPIGLRWTNTERACSRCALPREAIGCRLGFGSKMASATPTHGSCFQTSSIKLSGGQQPIKHCRLASL
jgi:hypothetical protein